MRTLPTPYNTSVLQSSASLCGLIEIIRTDGTTYYFTDHDADILAYSHTYKAACGFNASAIETGVGSNAHTMSFTFLASAAGVTKRMIDRGLFDHAKVTYMFFDWKLSGIGAVGVAIFAGIILSAAFGDSVICQFTASTLLGQDLPIAAEKYSPTCRHDFGDSGCGVNIVPTNDRPRVGSMPDPGTLVFNVNRGTGVGELSPDGYYNNGTAIFYDGPLAGQGFEIEQFVNDGTSATTTAYLKVPILTGDDVTGSLVNLYGGCDKFLLGGCTYWNNTKRFGGEPFQVIPMLDLTDTATLSTLSTAAATTGAGAVTSPAVSPTPVTEGTAPADWQQLLPFTTPAGNANDYTTVSNISW